MRLLVRLFLTPTVWGTVAGAIMGVWGHHHAGAALLIAVGYGGIGLSLSQAIAKDNGVWWWLSVLEEWWESMTGRDNTLLIGLLTHAPQAAIGTWMMWTGPVV